jgi:hypothetical protein
LFGRRGLGGLAGLVTSDTILRWYRELITPVFHGDYSSYSSTSSYSDRGSIMHLTPASSPR